MIIVELTCTKIEAWNVDRPTTTKSKLLFNALKSHLFGFDCSIVLAVTFFSQLDVAEMSLKDGGNDKYDDNDDANDKDDDGFT